MSGRRARSGRSAARTATRQSAGRGGGQAVPPVLDRLTEAAAALADLERRRAGVVVMRDQWVREARAAGYTWAAVAAATGTSTQALLKRERPRDGQAPAGLT